MRIIATIIFIIQLLLIPGPQTVWIPSAEYLDWEETITVPDDYYERGCVIPLGMSVETWLTELEWPYPLVEHVWDCSETSMYTEWVLENCGYSTVIVLAQVMWRGRPMGHAYVRVRIDGVWRSYEATTRKWIPGAPTTICTRLCPSCAPRIPDLIFTTIVRLYDFFRDADLFNNEFAWWLR